MSQPTTPPARPAGARWRRILSLEDLEPAARAHLPRPVYGYVSSAADTATSLRENRSAYDDLDLLPHMLIDVSQATPEVELFGQRWKSPFGVSPIGLSALSAYRGDLVLAEAAAAQGVPMIMSGSSLIRMEEVAERFPASWFQAYLPGEQQQVVDLLERVRVSGFQTLVITVDTPAKPNLEQAIRLGFNAPLRPSLRLAWDGMVRPRWLFGTFLRTIAKHGLPHFENNYAHRGAPILSANVMRDFAERGRNDWARLQSIRDQWKGRMVVKGILHPADARRACDMGADAIIVSNHGGRQLDSAVAPLRVLPEIVRACPDVPVMIDGGIRRGSDAIKALALGARMVFVGRPWIYSAALGGAPGVQYAMHLFRQDILRNMAMLGINRLDELDTAYLRLRQPVALTPDPARSGFRA